MACVNRQQKRRKNQPPWWDADCQSAKAEKYSSLKQFRRTNLQCDFSVNLFIAKGLSRALRHCVSRNGYIVKSKSGLNCQMHVKIPKEYWR